MLGQRVGPGVPYAPKSANTGPMWAGTWALLVETSNVLGAVRFEEPMLHIENQRFGPIIRECEVELVVIEVRLANGPEYRRVSIGNVLEQVRTEGGETGRQPDDLGPTVGVHRRPPNALHQADLLLSQGPSAGLDVITDVYSTRCEPDRAAPRGLVGEHAALVGCILVAEADLESYVTTHEFIFSGCDDRLLGRWGGWLGSQARAVRPPPAVAGRSLVGAWVVVAAVFNKPA